MFRIIGLCPLSLGLRNSFYENWKWCFLLLLSTIDDILGYSQDEEETESCQKHNEGVLKMVGDELTAELSERLKTKDLCKNIFKKCLQ